MLMDLMDIKEKVQMAIASDQQTMIMTWPISQKCIPKVHQYLIVLQVVMLMKNVLHSTMAQKMDTVTNTRQILLLTMLEVEMQTGHATNRYRSMRTAILHS